MFVYLSIFRSTIHTERSHSLSCLTCSWLFCIAAPPNICGARAQLPLWEPFQIQSPCHGDDACLPKPAPHRAPHPNKNTQIISACGTGPFRVFCCECRRSMGPPSASEGRRSTEGRRWSKSELRTEDRRRCKRPSGKLMAHPWAPLKGQRTQEML